MARIPSMPTVPPMISNFMDMMGYPRPPLTTGGVNSMSQVGQQIQDSMSSASMPTMGLSQLSNLTGNTLPSSLSSSGISKRSTDDSNSNKRNKAESGSGNLMTQMPMMPSMGQLPFTSIASGSGASNWNPSSMFQGIMGGAAGKTGEAGAQHQPASVDMKSKGGKGKGCGKK